MRRKDELTESLRSRAKLDNAAQFSLSQRALAQADHLTQIRRELGIETLDADPRYAEEARILRRLTNGLAGVEWELDSIRIEDYLQERPRSPNAGPLQERLSKNRASLKQALEEAKAESGAPPAEVAKAESNSPPAVVAALTLLTGGPVVRRGDRKKKIAQLEDDAFVLREGILAQKQVVDQLGRDASAALNTRLLPKHRVAVRKHFRALQAAAATNDELQKFRSGTLASGHEFRDDILQEPNLRSMAILGSEGVWDSEISRTRRLLEDLGIIP